MEFGCNKTYLATTKTSPATSWVANSHPNLPFISTTGLYLSVNKVYLRKVDNALRFPMVALMATFWPPLSCSPRPSSPFLSSRHKAVTIMQTNRS